MDNIESTVTGDSIDNRLKSFLAGESAPVQESVKAEPAQKQQPIEVEAEAETEIEAESVGDEGAETESETLDLSDLAQYMGLDADKLDYEEGQLLIKTKIDGAEGKAKLADLVKSYQLEGHLNKKSIELSEQQKTLQAKIAEADTVVMQKVQQLEDLSNLAYGKLVSDYNKVNWQELREVDPTEFLIKQQEFNQANANIKQAMNQVAMERQKAEAKRQESYQSYLVKESELLLTKIPEWKNEEVAKKEKSELREFAKSSGFSNEEINSLSDHRLASLFRKAMMYDKYANDKATIEKKVAAAPKIVKPGSSNKQSASTALSKIKDKIKGSGGKAGLEDYFKMKGII